MSKVSPSTTAVTVPRSRHFSLPVRASAAGTVATTRAAVSSATSRRFMSPPASACCCLSVASRSLSSLRLMRAAFCAGVTRFSDFVQVLTWLRSSARRSVSDSIASLASLMTLSPSSRQRRVDQLRLARSSLAVVLWSRSSTSKDRRRASSGPARSSARPRPSARSPSPCGRPCRATLHGLLAGRSLRLRGGRGRGGALLGLLLGLGCGLVRLGVRRASCSRFFLSLVTRPEPGRPASRPAAPRQWSPSARS